MSLITVSYLFARHIPGPPISRYISVASMVARNQ
jgi:hypothetical protein